MTLGSLHLIKAIKAPSGSCDVLSVVTGSSAAPAPPAPAQPRAGSHLSGRGSDNCDNWSRAAAAARWRLFLLSPINCVIYNKGGVTTDFHGVLLREYSAITPTPAPARSAAESVEEGGASAWIQWPTHHTLTREV